MSTIGNVIVKLQAQHDMFSKGIKEAKKSLDELKSSVDTVKSALLGALAFVGLQAGISGLQQLVTEVVNNGKAAYQMASSLGIATESLIALQEQAKDNGVDDFNVSLLKLQKNLGEAATSGGPVAATLNKLGLSAEKLANGKLDSAIEQIADKISSIENPAERATYLTDLFGKSGQKLDPMFQQGAQGIRDARAEAIAIGQALTDVDAAKLTVAWGEMDKVADRIEGLKNKIVVGIAPVIDVLAQKFVDLIPDANSVGSIITDNLHYVAKAVGFVSDMVHSLHIIWLAAKTGVAYAVQGIISAIDALAQATSWLLDKVGLGFDTTWLDNFSDSVHATLEETQAELLKVGSEKFPSEGVDAAFDDIMKKIDETTQKTLDAKPKMGAAVTDAFSDAKDVVSKTLADLQHEIDTFGKSATDKKIFDIRKSADDARAEIDSLSKTLQDQFGKIYNFHVSVDQIQGADGGELIKKLKDVQAQNGVGNFPAFDMLLSKLEQIQSKKISVDAKVNGLNEIDAAAQKLEALNAAKKASDEISKLNTEISKVGKTDLQKKLIDVDQMGLGKEAADKIKSMLTLLDQLNKKQELMSEGKGLTDSFKSSVEKYKDEYAHLLELYNSGAIDRATFNKARDKARAEAMKTEELPQVEALVKRNDFTIAGTQRTDPTQTMEEIAQAEKDVLEEAQKQNETLAKIAENTANMIMSVATF